MPPSPNARGRASLATVDRTILDGTTMDEVERYHLKTLKMVLQETKEEAEELERAERTRL